MHSRLTFHNARHERLGLRAQQDYQVVNLWQEEAGRVLAEELLPLLPFVPIMRGGQEERVLQQALNRLRAEPGLADLENLLAFLARFVLDAPLVQRLMRWDMAILRESPWYQEILKEGEERGEKRGEKRGEERGRRVVEQQLLNVLAHRLGAVPDDVQALLRGLSLDELQLLFDPALEALSWAEFRAHLPARGQKPERSN